MTKIWQEILDDERDVDAIIKNLREFPDIPLNAGARLAGSFPRDGAVELRLSNPPPDFFRAGMMPIVSGKLMKILEESAPGSAEFFPIIVERKKKRVGPDWFCLNVIEVVDCLHREKSVFKPEKDYAVDITRIVIREDVVGSRQLFKVQKTIPSLTCTSDLLADKVLSAGCTGVAFKTPEEWRNPAFPWK